jgi:cell surface protein SprA
MDEKRLQTRVIYPADYSTSYFFVDTLYRKFFFSLHSSITPSLTQEMAKNKIVEIEVWTSLTVNQSNPNKRIVNAYIDLPPIARGQSYPSSYDSLTLYEPGFNESRYFVRLDSTQYKWNSYGGYVALNTNINEGQAIAVAYRIENYNWQTDSDDEYYGEISSQDTSLSNPLILKLIKPATPLFPGYLIAWKLQLRNIYPVGGKNLESENFKVNIYFKPPGSDTTAIISGISLLRLLDVDRYNEINVPVHAGDARFDFIPNITVDVERAEIIFPSLEPFREALRRNYYQIKNEPFPDSLVFHELYDTNRTIARNNVLNHSYHIWITREIDN